MVFARTVTLAFNGASGLPYGLRLLDCLLPPSPGFDGRPEAIGDLVDFIVARILDHLGVVPALGPRWGVRVAPPTVERT